jgi:hypothetical protein
MFKNPIAPRSKNEKKRSPWDFRCPPYDERTSCYVNAGSHFGIGFNNPVGHTSRPKERVNTMPFGRRDTMQTSYVPPRQLDLEILE